MSDIARHAYAIRVENLGKKYTLGGQKSAVSTVAASTGAVSTVDSFRESLTNLYRRNAKTLNVERKTHNVEEFWALKDINFEINVVNP